MDAHVVRVRLLDELDGAKRRLAFKERLRNPVHPVHQLTLRAKNYWIGEVGLVHELHVPHQNPNRRRGAITVEPVGRVDFLDRGKGDLSYWQRRR